MQAPMLSHLKFIVLLAGAPSLALADGFDLFSKHEELKGYVIVDAGDFEKVNPPIGKLGGNEVLTLNSNCFHSVSLLGIWGYGKKSGLLLVDRNKSIKVALLESSIGSIKVETVSVIQVPCQTADGSGLPVDLQQRLQEFKRQQELLQEQLERLRQQQKK